MTISKPDETWWQEIISNTSYLQRQAHIPPTVAPGPGSRGNQRPLSLRKSLSCKYPKPACTLTSRSWICTQLFIIKNDIKGMQEGFDKICYHWQFGTCDTKEIVVTALIIPVTVGFSITITTYFTFSFSSRIFPMFLKSMLSPWCGLNICPSREVPPPNGTTGSPCIQHNFSTLLTLIMSSNQWSKMSWNTWHY